MNDLSWVMLIRRSRYEIRLTVDVEIEVRAGHLCS